jgi:hypothetical protein
LGETEETLTVPCDSLETSGKQIINRISGSRRQPVTKRKEEILSDETDYSGRGRREVTGKEKLGQ